MNRLLNADQALLDEFNFEEYTPPEYVAASLSGQKATCTQCGARWGFPMGPDGTITMGDRNSLLEHAKAHRTKGLRMRRL